jgi:hypothetical protein
MKKLEETLDIHDISLHRRDDCKNYGRCLDEASAKRWRSFSCLYCEKFEHGVRLVPCLRRDSMPVL